MRRKSSRIDKKSKKKKEKRMVESEEEELGAGGRLASTNTPLVSSSHVQSVASHRWTSPEEKVLLASSA